METQKWGAVVRANHDGRIGATPLSPQERQHQRLRSKAIPLVADAEPLDVIFEDENYLVVNKPAFVKIHPSHRCVA